MLCGHRHRVFIHEPSEGINFPVIENGHNTLLQAETKGDHLHLTITNLDGKIVESLVFGKK
jgi:hypothetical protein